MKLGTMLGAQISVLVAVIGIGALSTGCMSGEGGEGDALDDDEKIGQGAQGISYAPGYDIHAPTAVPCGTPFPIVWYAPPGHSAYDWIAVKNIETSANGSWTPYTVVDSTYAGSTSTFGVAYLSVKCATPAGHHWKVEFYGSGKVAESSPFTVSGSYLPY